MVPDYKIKKKTFVCNKCQYSRRSETTIKKDKERIKTYMKTVYKNKIKEYKKKYYEENKIKWAKYAK